MLNHQQGDAKKHGLSAFNIGQSSPKNSLILKEKVSKIIHFKSIQPKSMHRK